MDFGAVFKLKQAWNVFCGNHPKVPGFVAEVSAKQPCVGQEIAVAVRYPDGTEVKTGIRLQESDLELLELLQKMR